MFASLFRADGADDRSVFGDFWFSPIGQNSSAGVRVGPDQAMRLSTVYRCVRVLAATMASLPPCFYRPKGRGREKVTDIPLYKLLAKRPNRFQNSFQWHQMMMGHLALRGTGYNRIITDGRGEVAELIPMHPDRMKVEALDDRGRYRYKYKQADGSEEILPAGAVFKIMGFSANGYTGLNPMEVAVESVGEGLAQQSYGARFFANDARPLGGWIKMPGKFANDDARNLWRESFQRAQAGNNRGKIAVLEGGMEYMPPVGVSNKDAQMLEAKNAKVADICRWFGVPPHLAFALDRATDNNIERLSLEFIKFTMRENAECFEAAVEDQLLDPDSDLELEYDMDKLARGEMQARGQFYQLGINGGWLTRNEARHGRPRPARRARRAAAAAQHGAGRHAAGADAERAGAGRRAGRRRRGARPRARARDRRPRGAQGNGGCAQCVQTPCRCAGGVAQVGCRVLRRARRLRSREPALLDRDRGRLVRSPAG
jgi:HK97 family phage portal protein